MNEDGCRILDLGFRMKDEDFKLFNDEQTFVNVESEINVVLV